MPDFILQRDFVLRSRHGLSIRFTKGLPTHVPERLAEEAVGIGAVPVHPPAPVDDLLEAIRLLAEEADAEKFTVKGAPRTEAVEAIVGRDLKAAEVAQAWAEFKGGRE
ncbi:MAG: hypothetical protein LBU11_12335 [Zoogloeaceae bacterium]|jgi:hypothetical protein|nr:hypothetical protein [Zoogloeaceae bacterium]